MAEYQEQFQLGKDAQMFMGLNGGEPTTLIENVGDIKPNRTLIEASRFLRSQPVEVTAAIGHKVEVEFDIVASDDDEVYMDLVAADVGLEPRTFKFLSKENGHGFQGDFVVSVGETFPVGDIQAATVKIKPTKTATAFQWLMPS
jgi:hypothetical protein